MAFVFAERLIEFAIRIGTDDVMKDPTQLQLMFFVSDLVNKGANMSPDSVTPKVHEKLPMDFFQQRLAEIPRTKSEVNSSNIFKDELPVIPDIAEYMKTANIKIIHGYPREAGDLPCISITLGNEEESTKYLGGEKATINAAGGKKYKILGSDWGSQINVSIMTTNYDELVIWHRIILTSLLKYRVALESYGMRNQNMAWADIEPAAEYLQGGIFAYQRTCILSCDKEQDVPVLVEGEYSELAFGIAGGPAGDGTIKPTPAGDPLEDA